MSTAHEYRLPPELDGETLAARLRERLVLERGAVTTWARTYFDTFDWRVHRAGGRLWTEKRDGRELLVWDPGGDREPSSATFQGSPGFARDLPAGALGEGLARVLSMRRVLPVAVVGGKARGLGILDRERKTVCRLALDERWARPGQGRKARRVLGSFLRVEPVLGYGERAAEVERVLAEELGLVREQEDDLEVAVAALGGPFGVDPSKTRVRLVPLMSAGQAVSAILLGQLRIIERNREGAIADLDSEFLHDLRVATRKTRSALSLLAGALSASVVAEFKAEFDWLGEVTGPTRDLDVYLLKMDGYRADLPAEAAANLEPLQRYLEERQQWEQRRQARALRSKRFAELIQEWRSWLENGMPGDDAPDAPIPVVEYSSAKIWKAYKRVRRDGRAIGEDSPPGALHRLRIRGKKLRYLLDFFRDLYDAEEVAKLIKTLKALQDNLGDFNDYEVQQAAMGGFGRELNGREGCSVETLMALGRLQSRLAEGQRRQRERFAARIAGFLAPENHERYRVLCGRAAGEGP